MTVRSDRLISSLLTTTMSTKYTTPTGRTTIIKFIALSNPNAATRTITIQLGASATPRIVMVVSLATLTAQQFPVWFVLRETDILQAKQDTGSDCVIHASGTVLLGVAS